MDFAPANNPVSASTTFSSRFWPRVHRDRVRIVVMAFTVILILVGVMVSGVIDFRSAVVVPPDCPGRLAVIDKAITEWAVAKGKDSLSVPTEDSVRRYLHGAELPRCPQGGKYQYGTLSLATACSLHGHARIPNPPLSSTTETVDPKPNEPYDPNILRSRASLNSCIANLKQIDGAIQQWSLEHQALSNAVPPVAEVAEILKGGQFQVCPRGGKYFLHSVSENPECTMIGHSL